MLQPPVIQLGETSFHGLAHKGFDRARREVLAARTPRIAFLGNISEQSDDQLTQLGFSLGHAYARSAFAGCHDPVLLLCQTETLSSRGRLSVRPHVDVVTDREELDRILYKRKNISEPLDLLVAAQKLVSYNEFMSGENSCEAAAFFVVGRPNVDEQIFDAFGKIGSLGTPTFILHALPAGMSVEDDVRGSLSKCASIAGGLYTPYPAASMDILADHLGSIVTFATGIPSIVRGRVEQVSTPEGEEFAKKLAAPFADLAM